MDGKRVNYVLGREEGVWNACRSEKSEVKMSLASRARRLVGVVI